LNTIQKIYLVGNPNSGKSSLFNQLTGLEQKVANYPGVTTEKKTGVVLKQDQYFEITDLPGCYSLYPNSIDEKVVSETLLNTNPDLIIFTADASNLNRSLLLYTQVADLKIPIIVVLNMVDELDKKGEYIETDILEKELDTKIITCNSRKGKGIDTLWDFLIQKDYKISQNTFGKKDLFAEYHLEEQFSYRTWHEYVNKSEKNAIIENTKRKEIIDRYNQIEEILSLTLKKTQKAFKQKMWSDRIDQYALHPFWGIIAMLSILYIVFQFLFYIAQYPMEGLDWSFSVIASWLQNTLPKGLFSLFLTEAIIPGISGVLIFIPQIALLFFMNTWLEESGYLARMVFLLDRWMRKFGMSGKSVLPLLSGNACAIPAIASTKTISTHKERLITILSIPFMTCSARLPVYTLLISIIIPINYQGLALLSLYILGIFSAIVFSFILNKIIKTEEKSFLIMEIPPYRWPSMKNIFTNIRNAVKSFVKVAGKFILTISIILWFLASFGFQDKSIKNVPLDDSFVAQIGKFIEPAIEPLGYDWQIGVALVTSFAAREVFVSTLGTLYNIGAEPDENTMLQTMKLQINPKTNTSVFTFATGISLLLFYAFALQCMSTLAAIRKETGTYKWAIISFISMSILAYLSALLSYKIIS
jgi:ferrous iron transport protein B